MFAICIIKEREFKGIRINREMLINGFHLIFIIFESHPAAAKALLSNEERTSAAVENIIKPAKPENSASNTPTRLRPKVSRSPHIHLYVNSNRVLFFTNSRTVKMMGAA